MIYSMTGYGRVEKTINNNVYTIEIRSLNGKQFDLRMNPSPYLRSYEIEIRNLIADYLIRGSVECTIILKQNGSAKPVIINNQLFKSYYLSLKNLVDDLKLNDDHILNVIMKLPDVVTNNAEQIEEKEWNEVKISVLEALQLVNTHRKTEGLALEKDLLERIKNIEKLEEINASLAPLRKEKMKQNISKLLEEHIGKENYDENRLEQELIYYIEKLDISEEQVRLKNHCEYFKQILKEEEVTKGKKLSFLLQEFGREINTTGSKANDIEIQKNVVLMKDELEKAKEQILNVL